MVFHHLSDGRYNRQVYSMEPRGEAEMQLMENFKAWAQAENHELPEWMVDEHAYALRYISSFRDDYEKTYEYLMEH